MPELSRADRIAAAQKKLKEFQAAKANKNANESYSNQNPAVDTSGSADYQVNNTPQQTNYSYMLPSDNSQFSQGQPVQYQQHYNLPSVSNTGYYGNSEIYQPQQSYDVPSVSAEYNTTSNSLASYFYNPNNYYYSPAPAPAVQPPMPPPPPPPSGQASVPSVPSSNYATPPYPPPPTSTTCVVSHYGNGVSGGVSSNDYYTPVGNLTDDNQILSSPTSSSLSLASSAFQIPSSRNMHQEIPPPRPSVELNLSAYCNPLDLNDQNQITSDGCPAAAAATTTSTLSTSSVICPEVHQNTFSSMPYNVNISTNQLQEDVATTTTTKEESHLESEIDDKVTVDYMPTATTEKLLQLTRQLDGILETSERLTSLHTSGATSPLMNSEYSSSFRTGNNRLLSSPSSLLESYSYPELSSNQQNHRMVESYEQQHQQQKEFLRSTPNSYMSGQSSQVCTGQNSLVRELEERNVELASMLEKRNRAFERLQVKLDSMKEQYERRFNDLANERTTLQNSSQRDLEKTKEQIRAHAKTIGVLVAEKTELQSQVAHLDNLAAERLKEIEEITSRLKSSRQQILDLERSASESKTVVNELHTGNNDLRSEVERLQVDLKREKSARQNLENELSETNSRLTAKSCELAQMGISLNELKQQLELSQIYANQLGSTGESLASIENESYRHQQEWLTERVNLQNRLKELELSLSSADTEKGRLESQYRNYVAQVEQQSNELRTQLSETNKLKQELELSLESVNRKLREKDDEINDLTCRLSSVQIIQPTSQPVVETQSPNGNNEKSDVVVITPAASSSISTSDQSSIERIESLENQLKHRTVELDNSTTEIQRLTMQLYSLQETVKSLQASLVDRDSVLATATSERSALSRAMEQNKTLKQQIADLQDSYAQMTTTNANLSVQLQQLESECKQSSNTMTNYQKQVDELNKQCDAYQLELKSANEMNYALSKQIEHLNILQAESLNQVETMMNHSKNILSVDKIIQTIHIEDIEEQKNQGKSGSLQHEQYQRQQDEEQQQQQQQEATNMNALLAKIETDQIHVNQLTNEITMLRNLFTRITKLCYELQVQNEQDKELSQFSDPVYCINTLEDSVKQLMCKSSSSVNDNCVQCSISMEQKALQDLEILQVAHTQLEAKFIKCMEELSTVSEERSRLESVNAQLEMEATTVEEYVTLFTHRRAAAAKRARARELLLQRLVDDRKRLRARLQQLYKQMKPAQNTKEINGIHNEHLGDTNAEEVNDTNFSPGFLNEFQNLIQEIEPTIDESEFESDASNLNDEDMGNSMKDSTSGGGAGDHGEELVHHDLIDDIQQENHTAQLSSSLQSLRYHALRHDCPHCKCCVGNLLEV